ncbi:MAG TPA: response regulator [Methanoregula sp.]|nr:response regulator [Methanoregula sp.]
MEKKILVVEDDQVIQQLVEWRLKLLGYTVCGKATNAREAFTCVLENEPDAVLMDIHIEGGMDGIDAAAAIKKMNDIPIIFLTADSSRQEISRARAIMPAGYITKPFNDTDLRVALSLVFDKIDEKHTIGETETKQQAGAEESDLTLPDTLFGT